MAAPPPVQPAAVQPAAETQAVPQPNLPVQDAAPVPLALPAASQAAAPIPAPPPENYTSPPPAEPQAAAPEAPGSSTPAAAAAAPAAAAPAAPAPAPVAPPLKRIVPPDFGHADTDFDARISFEEAQKIWPHITRGRFNAADLDESGYLSADEYNALVRNPPE
ncbi:MAG TPA: hypothetical protein VHB74_11180 [Devosia sp.]|nr:hypothetical protein [Devosia sp.]